MKNSEEGVISSRYQELSRLREPFLRRARACSVMTKPTIIPPEGHDGSAAFPIPYQTIGAEGTNNFASRLKSILFPTGSPWLRYVIADAVLRDEVLRQNPEGISNIEKALSDRESEIRRYCETTNMGTTIGELCTHCIIAGNALLYIPQSEEPMRCYGMDRYVVRRTPAGRVLQLIIEEEVLASTLEPEVQKFCSLIEAEPAHKCKLYTNIEYNQSEEVWEIRQELNGTELPEDGVGDDKIGAWSRYPENPYIAVRWTQVDGEPWGRGYAEDLLGGLISLDVLSRAIVEGAQIAALSIIGVRNGSSTTKKRDVARAKNGDVITADFANDVTMFRADKHADFSVAERVATALTDSLQRAFLMHSAVQRKGERVTGFEIRAMIQALEEQIGSVYTIFASEVQPRVIKLIEKRMLKLGKLEPIQDGLVETSIVTGLEALGRGQDLQKLMEFSQICTQMFGAEAMAKYVKPHVAMQTVAACIQLEHTDFIKTEEEVAKEMAAAQQAQQQMQAQQMLGQLASPAAQVITKGMEQAGAAAPAAAQA